MRFTPDPFTPDSASSLQAPRWHNHCRGDNPPPAALIPWLFNPGSLTARLQTLSHGDFGVKIIQQRWATPRHDERQALGLCGRQQALIREVILRGQGEDWVYARSVLPASSLTGSLRHLRHLDSRPLGAMLFTYPRMHRDPIEIAAFAPGSGIIPAPWCSERPLWGRRSCFYLDGKPLLVSEVFLEAFLTTIHTTPTQTTV